MGLAIVYLEYLLSYIANLFNPQGCGDAFLCMFSEHNGHSLALRRGLLYGIAVIGQVLAGLGMTTNLEVMYNS